MSGATATASGLRHQSYAHLGAIEFGEDVVRVTDAGVNIIWGGNTYVGGDLIEVDPIPESAELRTAQVRVRINGVQLARIAQFLAYHYLGRKLRIWRAWFDDAGAIIVDPMVFFIGELDEPTFHEDPEARTATIEWLCTSPWGDFERRNGRHTNHAEQQLHFPGDRGFEYVSDAAKPVSWGRPGPTWGGGSPPNPFALSATTRPAASIESNPFSDPGDAVWQTPWINNG